MYKNKTNFTKKLTIIIIALLMSAMFIALPSCAELSNPQSHSQISTESGLQAEKAQEIFATDSNATSKLPDTADSSIVSQNSSQVSVVVSHVMDTPSEPFWQEEPDESVAIPEDANEIARIFTERETYSISQNPVIIAKVENKIVLPISCSEVYILEKKVNGEWNGVQFSKEFTGFHMIGLIFYKGTGEVFRIKLTDYQTITPGEYRILYNFYLDKKEYEIECSFDLTN